MKNSINFCLLAFSLYSQLAGAFAPPTYRQFGITSRLATALSMAVTKEDLLGARDAIDKILDEKNCGPIFVRLAWHDSGKMISTVNREGYCVI